MPIPVSVIVPLYNKAPFVRRALDSIARQTFRDFEVIVVNDGSTDGGGHIASEYPDARVRVITQANAGPGAARNRGIAEAAGEFIATLDADDEWASEYLGHSLALFEKHGPAVVTVTSAYLEEPAGRSTVPMWRRRGLTDGVHRIAESTSPALLTYMLAYMTPCSTVARAAAIRKWGGFYDQDHCLYAEDAVLWLKVLLNETVAFSLEPLVRVHFEASGVSHKRHVRPVEPFLQRPELVEAACPDRLRPLLRRFLAGRAYKTACVLGYWGLWRQAAALRRRFAMPGWRLPYYFPSLVCSTPVGAALGWVARRARGPANAA